MIKCNVTVIGTVSRPVELKNGRDGKPFVTFGLNVLVKDNQESKNIDISVASDGEDDDSLSLSKGDRVKLKGVLSLKRIGDATYFNLSADELSLNPKGADSITGQVQFRGTLGGKGAFHRFLGRDSRVACSQSEDRSGRKTGTPDLQGQPQYQLPCGIPYRMDKREHESIDGYGY